MTTNRIPGFDIESVLETEFRGPDSLSILFLCHPDLITAYMDVILAKDSLFLRLFNSLIHLAYLLRYHPGITTGIVNKLLSKKEFYPLIAYKQVFPEIAQAVDPDILKRRHTSFITLTHSHFVIPQQGPNCLYYAISLVLSMYSCHIPPRKREYYRRFERSLREIGKKEVGIKGIGGVYDLQEVISLLAFVGFIGEIISVESVKSLKRLVELAVTYNVPILFPYNRTNDTDTGESAHYAVIIGYYNDHDGDFKILITHDGQSEIYTAHSLFARNNNLIESPIATYGKKSKGDNYVKLDNEKNAEGCYKAYTYPKIDLTHTLKNRMLFITNMAQNQQLKEEAFFRNRLKAFKK